MKAINSKDHVKHDKKNDNEETKDAIACFTNKIAMLEEIIKNRVKELEEKFKKYLGHTNSGNKVQKLISDDGKQYN